MWAAHQCAEAKRIVWAAHLSLMEHILAHSWSDVELRKRLHRVMRINGAAAGASSSFRLARQLEFDGPIAGLRIPSSTHRAAKRARTSLEQIRDEPEDADFFED